LLAALGGAAAAWPLAARAQRAGRAFHAFGCPSEPWLASWIYEYAPLIDLDPDRLDDGAPFIDFRFEESLKLIGRTAQLAPPCVVM
jgi:hypothetical protein